MAFSKVFLYDKDGHQLAELDVASVRSWVMDGYGRCQFIISKTDQNCTRTNLQIGNLIRVVHIPSIDLDGSVMGKLVDWVGMILLPRDWNFGEIRVTAYSAEAILLARPMPFIKLSGTPDANFKQILTYSNAFGGIPIQPGDIWPDAAGLPEALKLSAYEHIRNITTAAGRNWDVTCQVDANADLHLYANYYKAKGIDTGRTFTEDNTELTTPFMSEVAKDGGMFPWNNIIGYGDANTTGARDSYPAEDIPSESLYGPFGRNQMFNGITGPSPVKQASISLLNSLSNPVLLLPITALNNKDTLSYVVTGNVWNYSQAQAGFSDDIHFGTYNVGVRILSIDYADKEDKAKMTIGVTSDVVRS